MQKKIVKIIIYTLVAGSVLVVAIPWGLITLNDFLNLPSFSSFLFKILGILFFLVGTANYFYCHYLFLCKLKRTPLITESSGSILQEGAYKYSRNPIYLGYLIMFFGIFLFFGKFLLFLYWLLIFLGLHFGLIYFEEPQLKRTLGKQYDNYVKKVPRWI